MPSAYSVLSDTVGLSPAALKLGLYSQGPVDFTGKCFDCISTKLVILSESSTGALQAEWILKAGFFNNTEDIVSQAVGQINWDSTSNIYSFSLWAQGQPSSNTFLTGTIHLGLSGRWNGGDLRLVGVWGPSQGSGGHGYSAQIAGFECDQPLPPQHIVPGAVGLGGPSGGSTFSPAIVDEAIVIIII
jgi:hypothetical protein